MAEAKTQRASDQKLKRARADGDIQISAAFCSAAAFAGFCGTAAWSGPAVLAAWQKALSSSFALASTTATGTAHVSLVEHAKTVAIGALEPCLVPLAAAGACAALAGLVQSAGLFSLGALGPRASGWDVGARVRALVSIDRGWSWVTSAVSLAILVLVVWLTCRSSIAGVLAISGLPRVRALQALGSLFEALAVRVLFVALALGLADAVLRRVRHYQRQRMTRREVMDEQREQYGDPHTRTERTRHMRKRGAGA